MTVGISLSEETKVIEPVVEPIKVEEETITYNVDCYLLSLRWFFPWRAKGDTAKERKYFPQFLRTKVSIQ